MYIFGRALLVKHFYQLSCIKLIKSNSKDIYNVVKNPETTKRLGYLRNPRSLKEGTET